MPVNPLIINKKTDEMKEAHRIYISSASLEYGEKTADSRGKGGNKKEGGGGRLEQDKKLTCSLAEKRLGLKYYEKIRVETSKNEVHRIQ